MDLKVFIKGRAENQQGKKALNPNKKPKKAEKKAEK